MCYNVIGDFMRSVKEKTVNEIIVNKSRFIAVIYPVFDIDDTHDLLKTIKKEYLNASHYTYAYIIGDEGRIQKASDDGEPTRTAGFPILDVLHKNDMTNVLLIVIRYFGGIKLGAGGLIRAYSTAASDVLKHVVFTKKTTTFTCRVECSYDHLGPIDKYLRENTELLNVAYDSSICFTFKINSECFETVKENLFNKNGFTDTLKKQSEVSEYV